MEGNIVWLTSFNTSILGSHKMKGILRVILQIWREIQALSSSPGLAINLKLDGSRALCSCPPRMQKAKEGTPL